MQARGWSCMVSALRKRDGGLPELTFFRENGHACGNVAVLRRWIGCRADVFLIPGDGGTVLAYAHSDIPSDLATVPRLLLAELRKMADVAETDGGLNTWSALEILLLLSSVRRSCTRATPKKSARC